MSSLSSCRKKWRECILHNLGLEMSSDDMETYDTLERILLEKIQDSKSTTISVTIEASTILNPDFETILNSSKTAIRYFEFKNKIGIKIEKIEGKTPRIIDKLILSFIL